MIVGIGGAPSRATTLPEDAASRKQYPVATGFIDYFPDAIAAIAHLSWRGNEQHNAGMALHWDRSKSADEADTLMRHFLQRGTLDTDGIRHTVKVAWRALALLQKEIEAEQQTQQEPQQPSVDDSLRCPQDGQPNCCPGSDNCTTTCVPIARRNPRSYLNTGIVSFGQKCSCGPKGACYNCR